MRLLTGLQRKAVACQSLDARDLGASSATEIPNERLQPSNPQRLHPPNVLASYVEVCICHTTKCLVRGAGSLGDHSAVTHMLGRLSTAQWLLAFWLDKKLLPALGRLCQGLALLGEDARLAVRHKVALRVVALNMGSLKGAFEA